MNLQVSSLQISLKLGERITGCYPLADAVSDRLQQELAMCNQCPQPTYRIVTITSAAGLERRASFCPRHFAAFAKLFPGAERQSA